MGCPLWPIEGGGEVPSSQHGWVDLVSGAICKKWMGNLFLFHSWVDLKDSSKGKKNSNEQNFRQCTWSTILYKMKRNPRLDIHWFHDNWTIVCPADQEGKGLEDKESKLHEMEACELRYEIEQEDMWYWRPLYHILIPIKKHPLWKQNK